MSGIVRRSRLMLKSPSSNACCRLSSWARRIKTPGGAGLRRGWSIYLAGIASLRPPHGPHLARLSSAAEEPVAAVGLEPRDVHAGGHLELLEHFARSRI